MATIQETGFDTIWPADTVEFCPHEDASNIFVCGTYHIVKTAATAESQEAVNEVEPERPKPQKRYGKVLLFEATDDVPEVGLQQIQTVDYGPAVPDLKWCHRQSNVAPFLAAADSEGGIQLFEYQVAQKQLIPKQTIACADPHVLCLSIDWSNIRTPTTGLGSLAVSMSDGNISVLHPNSSELAVSRTWAAHDFEPWVAAWNYWDTNVVYTGGDDYKMKAWDVREDCTQPIFSNKRFGGGVTSIQSHSYVEHLLAVGSYDESVRLFDVRKPLQPLVQADVGGGVWRVKWHPSPERKQDLLVACMLDGAKVVRFNDEIIGSSGSEPWEITQRFDKHKSMTYGADWSTKPSAAGETMIASCSFYDHVIHMWRG